MQKIAVFYDSADLNVARAVAGEIRSLGFVSWLADDDCKTDWHAEVDELLSTNLCVGAVVLWSEASKKNSVVRDEAKEVARVGKPLLGVLLNATHEAPIGLRDGPRHQLERKQGGEIDSALASKIRTVFGGAATLERSLILNGKKLSAPSMILSVSSFETQIEPDPTLSLLSQVCPPAVLVSAYDLLRPEPTTKITDIGAINRLRETGSMVFLDSGNYEAMRLKDSKWGDSKKRLLEAQAVVSVDLAFTHDSFPEDVSQSGVCIQSRIDKVSEEYERDRSLVSCAVAPIVHAPRVDGGRYHFDSLPEICCGVVRAVDPPMIAVAERELGDGLMKRVQTIARIRKALQDQGSNTLLHVLGTGNPISMAFLSMAGADFFDGLEWCRTAIDGQRWRLYHFQQWDLFASQHGLINSPEIAQLIKDQSGGVPWITKVALHNMAFFMQASSTIRTHHRDGEYELLFTYKDLANEYQQAKRLIEDCK